jgi:hypothetical protein
MTWSDVGISCGSKDHPDTELFDKNLPFVVKIPIKRHKATKTLIDSGALLNLMMMKTFIEMGLNLAELTPRAGHFPQDHPRAVIHSHQTHRPRAVL